MQVLECFGNCDLRTLGALFSTPSLQNHSEEKELYCTWLDISENQTDGQQTMNVMSV